MNILTYTLKSWRNRKLSIWLSCLIIAVSVLLILSTEKIRSGIKSSFTANISQTDLIVGARSGPLNLLLSLVFQIGAPANNISYQVYQKFQSHSMVKWSIPISLGDNHKGFRVIGTSNSLFSHYRFRQNRQIEFKKGTNFNKITDIVIGFEVARQLGYDLGKTITLTHGYSEKSFSHHEENPFRVVGIMKETFTPLDRSLFVSLEAIEYIHSDLSENSDLKNQFQPTHISGFFLGLKSRISILQMQREINDFGEEALTAIVPLQVLAGFWNNLSYIETALFAIAVLVLIIGLLTMLISVYTVLQERRREIAILRALGAQPQLIFLLMMIESFVIAFLGLVLGFFLLWGIMVIVLPVIETLLGIYIAIDLISLSDLWLAVVILSLALFIALVPALRAFRNTLNDGLQIRL